MEHEQAYPPPAAPSAYPPLATPLSVIGPQYCYPQPVDLAAVRKVLTITEGNFAVTDINGNIMFKIKGKFFSIHDRRLLTDAAGNPVCTLRPKMASIQGRKHGRKRSDIHSEAIINDPTQDQIACVLGNQPKRGCL
ncbi:hypothetical protein ES319_D08G095600v1 [Gossypium barbadense]|uniref:Uncharacterized protein n=1 Tax=Gossypium barbadense TaxID=3634 RepID=A0A5J5QDZ4_GOSBA|nr:hypothetical protein ES319_D08G095600v1 [Gossypium barbadense]